MLVRSSSPARALALIVSALVAGCEREAENLDPPGASEVASYYQYGGELTVEMSGNVAQLTAVIDRDEFRMGGDVWVKASPYIFLFSPGTRDAFTDLPGLGGVRAIVRYGDDGSLVAQALLERGTLNALTWDDALFVAGRARSEASQRPGYMRDLVRYGEDHTDYEYNPEYITSGS